MHTFTTLAPLAVYGIETAPGETLPAGTELRLVRRGIVVSDLYVVADRRIVGALVDDLSIHEVGTGEGRR